MKGFVFAAGRGERLRPVTDDIPKPLVPVMNLPVLCRPLALLRHSGIRDIVLNLHHLPGTITDFFEANDFFGCKVSFSREGELLGTGGGLMKCRALLDDSDFVVLNGDVLMDLDIPSLLKHHRANFADATVVLYRHPRSREIGPVLVREDRVLDFKNFLGAGADSDYIYTGAAALSPAVFHYLETGFSSVVYTAYVDIIRKGRLDYFIHDGFWYDVGSPEELYRANMDFRNGIGSLDVMVGDVLGMKATVLSGLATIHPDAVITGSIVGAGAEVGKEARVTDSVLLPGARVPAGARVDAALVYKDRILTV